MKLAEMCRKLETEEEKVLPFYASSLTQEEHDDVEAAVAEAPSEPLANVSIKAMTVHTGSSRSARTLTQNTVRNHYNTLAFQCQEKTMCSQLPILLD